MSLSGAKNEVLDQDRLRQQYQHSNEMKTTHVNSELKTASCWVPPKIDSDDDDDEFWSAAAAIETTEPPASVAPQSQTQWQPPAIKDDDDEDEAFWNQAAAFVDRVEEDQNNVAQTKTF
jgi:hypothetical protein